MQAEGYGRFRGYLALNKVVKLHSDGAGHATSVDGPADSAKEHGTVRIEVQGFVDR